MYLIRVTVTKVCDRVTSQFPIKLLRASHSVTDAVINRTP